MTLEESFGHYMDQSVLTIAHLTITQQRVTEAQCSLFNVQYISLIVHFATIQDHSISSTVTSLSVGNQRLKTVLNQQTRHHSHFKKEEQ